MAILDQHLLTAIVVLPLLGALFCLSFPTSRGSGVRGVALAVTLGNLALGALSWARFAPGVAGWQLVETVPWVARLGIGWSLGVDGLGLCLALLSLTLAPLVVLAAMGGGAEHSREQMVCLLLMQGAMLGAIVALDLMVFYIFFEGMLLPALFWVLLLGGPRRQHAASRFMLTTLAGSLPMLVALLGTVRGAANFGPLTFYLPEVSARLGSHALGGAEVWLFAGFCLAFSIKAALFPWHSWLPPLYEEAPAGATALLAGVMSKVGALCLLRYGLVLFPQAAAQALPLLAVLAVVGIVWGGCLAVAQTTLRGLLAYASMSHMGLMALGLLAMTPLSLAGAMVQMLNHGLCIAGLFLLVGVLGERRGLRTLGEGGGLARTMPAMATLFVVLTMGFIGLPGLGGFLGELMVFLGTYGGTGPRLAASVGQLAAAGVWGLGLAGLGALAALALGLTRARPRLSRLGQATVLAVASALLSVLVAPPVGAMSGGLLVRPLAGLLHQRHGCQEIFAICAVASLATTVLGAIYMLYMVQRLFFGPPRTPAPAQREDLSPREVAMVLPLVLLTLWLGLQPQPVLRVLEPVAGELSRQFRAAAALPARAASGGG